MVHVDLPVPQPADPKHAIDSQRAAISPEWESEEAEGRVSNPRGGHTCHWKAAACGCDDVRKMELGSLVEGG